jgi:hypothetical protein
LIPSFDEGLFLLWAVLDIVGAILAFSAVAVTYIIFNGSLPVKIFDFFLLGGIIIVSVRTAYLCFRPQQQKAVFASRIIAGCYNLFLVVAALFYLSQLFSPH